ncbi:MAG: DinB family protein [Gemmatimonadaceae bacterium]|nr:DinB family protein [Gemmatimonadaceae bacterium]
MPEDLLNRSTRDLLLEAAAAVEEIIHAVESLPAPGALRVGDWSATDVLAHVTFWHESFARTVRALSAGAVPDVLRGSYAELNRRGVEQSSGAAVAAIAARLRQAQGVIAAHIGVLPPGTMIPYRKGSRDYAPDEHLQVVRDHLRHHRRRIEAARRSSAP